MIAELENAAASGFFPLAPRLIKKAPGPDYDHLIAVEELKLRRVADAYEAGVDTLEDYARKKAKLTAGIEDLKAQQAAAQAEAEAAAVSPADMRRRVLDVLQILRDPTATEQVKNASLREILSHIIYDKPHAQLQLFFAF